MPYYTYKCQSCGAPVYLKMQMKDRRPDETTAPCTACEKDTKCSRVLDSFSFSIKGEKWS